MAEPQNQPKSGTDEDSQSTGSSPGMSQAMLSQIIAQSLGLAAQNAVVAQQQGIILHQAATSLGITQLYSSTQGSAADQNLTKTLEQIQKVAEFFKNQGSGQDSPDKKQQ